MNMEENKKDLQEQTPTNGEAAQGGNGGRKRRHHRRGHGRSGNGNNGANAVNALPAESVPSGNSTQPTNNTARIEGNAEKKAQPNAKQKNNNKPKQQKQQKQQNDGGRDRTNEKSKKEENRKDTYLYVLDGNLYVNLTNKCSNGCDFCVRNERTSYYGNYLWLKNGDPTAEKVMAAANGYGDLTRFKEVVFCGFGEPTYKVKEMVALCDYFHEKGIKTRLNTNGQGNLINKRDIVPELKGKIDFVNISLNASCVEKYQPICRSQFGEAGFAGLIEFAKLCKKNAIPCRFSIVDCIGEDEVEACKRLAQSVNVPLYVRAYITDS